MTIINMHESVTRTRGFAMAWLAVAYLSSQLYPCSIKSALLIHSTAISYLWIVDTRIIEPIIYFAMPCS